MSVPVSDMLDLSAVLLNDANKTQYTYGVMLPFYNMAQKDLREQMELNNVPVTNETSTSIVVPVNTTVIGFATAPALPADLVEIQKILERTNGTVVDYVPMTRRDFLPGLVEITSSLILWAWINQEIRLIGANLPIQLQLNYIAHRLPVVTSTATVVTLINAESFLQYRTAALCAEFIGENVTRATSLNNNARIALDSFLGIDTKGRQAISARRKPFRAAYKAKGY